MFLRIIGTGRALPENIINNDYLATIMDTSDDWIRSRTGIAERRMAKDETVVSLATTAAQEAIRKSGISPDEIDLILVTTMTPDNSCPNTACCIQKNINATNAIAIDMNTACSGFIFAMSIANAYVNANMERYKTVLVVSAEILTKLLDWSDRTTSILFGDGAGAAILKADNTGVLNIIEHTDGTKGDVLSVGSLPKKNLLIKEEKFRNTYMEGKEIFKFATTKVVENINELLSAAGIDINDISLFVLHQANINIITAIAKKLKQDLKKFPINLDRYGNMSSASIPVLLDEINEAGKIKTGDKIVIAGFGGGLTWAAALVQW